MENRKKKILMLQVINVVSYLVMITLNALANILPINNQTTGGVSDKYANLFAPAGITFAIWGLIYLMLGLFILYQWGLFTRETDQHEEVVLNVGWLFAASSFANTLWILLWHHDMILLTLLLMLVILVSLLFINRSLQIAPVDWRQRWLCNHAFSVYLGWISVATIANATTLFVSLGWNGFGLPEWAWTLLVMIVAAAIASIRLFQREDRPFSLVVVWALTGIVIKHISVFNREYPQIILAGVFLVGWISAIAVSSLLADFGFLQTARPGETTTPTGPEALTQPAEASADRVHGQGEPPTEGRTPEKDPGVDQN